MVWVRARPSSSRRSASMPITCRSASTPTRTRFGVRSATIATEWASTGSLLRVVAGGEHPHLRRQLRRHIQDGLTVVDQAMGDVLTDVVAAFHRPTPVVEPAACCEHRGVTGLVGAVAAHRDHLAAFVDHLDSGGALVRIHPDDRCHGFPLAGTGFDFCKEGTATSSRTDPFPATPRAVPGETAGHERATPMTPVGSRNVGASRRAPGSSLAGHRSWSKSLSSRQACAPVGGASSPSVPAGRGPSEDGVRETPRRLRVPRTSFRLGFPATGQLPLRRERGRQRAGRPTRRAALRDHRGRSSRSAC